MTERRWSHDHHTDHRGQQGPRIRNRPPSRRGGSHRLGRRPGCRAGPSGRRAHRGPFRAARRHRRRLRGSRREDRRGRGRTRRPGQQRRHRAPRRGQRDPQGRGHHRRGDARRLRDERLRRRPGHPRLPAAAAPVGRAGRRERQQRPGVPDPALRPRVVRALLPGDRLPGVQGRGQHDHGAVRQGAAGLPGQRRGAGLHQDRPQRQHRHAERRGGRGDHRPYGDGRA